MLRSLDQPIADRDSMSVAVNGIGLPPSDPPLLCMILKPKMTSADAQ